MKFHPMQRICLFLLLSLFLLPLARMARAEDKVSQADIDKAVSLLKSTGYPYTTTKSPTVWVMNFNGTHLKDIQVIMAIGGDIDSDLIVFVTVAQKMQMPATADFRFKLLKFNHTLDQVKVGFDGDDDLSVRIDSSLRLSDAIYLTRVIDQVKNASDNIYGQIQGELVP